MTILELELANYTMTNSEKMELLEKIEIIKDAFDVEKIKIDCNSNLNEFILITKTNPIYLEVVNPFVALGEEKIRLLQQGWTLDKIKKEFSLDSELSNYKKLNDCYYYRIV